MPPPGFEPGTCNFVKVPLYPLSYEGNHLSQEASRRYSELGMVRVVYPCKTVHNRREPE